MIYSVPFLGLEDMEIQDITAEVTSRWAKEIPDVLVRVDFTNNLVNVFEPQDGGPVLPRLRASYTLEYHES